MASRVLFYISGHGYGHARRAAQVIQSMVARDPSVSITIRTTTPAGLFKGITRTTVCRPDDPIDFGAVEHDALTIDVPATWAQVADLLSRKAQVVARERSFVEANRINLILTDIAYLPGEIAQGAGVRCLAIGNFTWDWIYASYVAGDPAKAGLVQQVRSMYGKMDGLLRLPFGHAVEAFRRVIDVPLVVNHPQWSRGEVMRLIGVDVTDSRPRVLIGMRGGVSGAAVRAAVESTPEIIFLSLQDYPGRAPEQFRHVKLDGRFDFTDLLSVCDAVISKLGYGTVAECIACGAAILWPRRSGFCEEEVMENICPQYVRMREIPLADYQSGNWRGHLRTLLEMPSPARSMRTDGADVCAELLLNMAAGGPLLVSSSLSEM